ncbi:hypothetical protein FSB84_17460 [Pseudobacter ginsenosidimutans]|uniref:hypothetical protein n=1 Tax=Pseudobacter ginsenosidimutans TaxID=661488 RepID=UPI0011BB0058|nr:hypothetical protein [Pseudobacter ginsenosidimutans]QEC43394.1 hypothetical protein FSB84_17460 [Pseudobacter ginsenosidimutans]
MNSLRPRNVVTPPVTVNKAFAGIVKTNGIIKTNDIRPLASGEAFVEFYSDSIYIVSIDGYLLVEGKYKAVAADSILLSSLGSLGGIKITDNKLEGRLHYTELDISVPITGLRTAAISTSEKTKLFSRHWYIAREEDYSKNFGEEVDSMTVRISSSGTYYARIFFQKQLLESKVMKWNWIGTGESKFGYSDPSDQDNTGEVTIRELTADLMRTSEWLDRNGDDVTEENRITLRVIK